MSNFSSINLCLFHFILCQQRAMYGYLLLNWKIHKHIPLKNGVSCSDLYRDQRTEFDEIFFIKTIRTVHHERFVIFFRVKKYRFSKLLHGFFVGEKYNFAVRFLNRIKKKFRLRLNLQPNYRFEDKVPKPRNVINTHLEGDLLISQGACSPNMFLKDFMLSLISNLMKLYYLYCQFP